MLSGNIMLTSRVDMKAVPHCPIFPSDGSGPLHQTAATDPIQCQQGFHSTAEGGGGGDHGLLQARPLTPKGNVEVSFVLPFTLAQ
ncbi:hypothetical protein CEXT_632181 [Caerostris extrusa]|uniref:Uncharacterized protein n=1 Tax=Caerostris extrusa TaxID=172846 RepID=A0AAV4Y7C9_CAEEX|nr:hypothetical protein CEXT_632181 [Caerostris extrusa]